MLRRKGAEKEQKKYARGIAALLTATLLVTQKLSLLAVESDRDNSIRSVRVQDAQIASSTLVIGSYLIELGGLGDHVYEIAMDSAGAFSQNRMYYKSELAEGQWFEITDAASIRDITNAGTPVNASVIEALEFTHRVSADGTVTDLRLQTAVNEFDIPDPYKLTEMEELEPIKMRYQYLQSKETKTTSDEKYLEIMEIFYGLSIGDDTTRDCDASLAALNAYRSDATAREKPSSWTEAVSTVMEGEDARRRVQSLNTLDLYLDELLKKAGGQAQEGLTPEETEAFYEKLQRLNGTIDDNHIIINDSSVNSNGSNVNGSDRNDSGKGESWYQEWRSLSESYQKMLAETGTYGSVVLDETFQVDTDMISAIGEAKSNVKTSIAKYTGKLLAEGKTASAQAVYQYSRKLIGCAKAHDMPGSDGATGRLADLSNILKSVIENSDSERETLEEELAEQALSVWRNLLSGGAGEDYRLAAGEGAAQSALAAYLSQRETDADSARLEYQTMLTELWKRMSNSLAQIDAGERIRQIGKLEELPPGDAAQRKLVGTVEKHLEWLRKSLAELIAASGDSTALDRLLQEQEELERQRLNALDENDLAAAKKLSAEMEAGENDIADLRRDLYGTLTDPNSSETDKARAAAGLTEGSAGKLIGELADRVTSAVLSDEDRSGLDNHLAALSALAQYDPSAAIAAVSKVRDALDDAADADGTADADADLIEKVSTQLADIERLVGSDGAGAGRGTLSEAQLNSLLADYFGTSSIASDQEKAAALIALSRYAEDTHNGAAKMLAVSIADRLAAEGSPYLYQKYDRALDPYLSLHAIGRIGGYRYLFDDVHHIVTLQKAGMYYIFTGGNQVYVFAENAKGELSAEPVLQNTLYIDSGDGSRIFECRGYYVPGCSFAAAETKVMEPVTEEIYQRLIRAE